jgi:hypothetical protein
MMASRAAGSLLIAGDQRYDIEVNRMLRLLASNGILTLGAAESAFVFKKESCPGASRPFPPPVPTIGTHMAMEVGAAPYGHWSGCHAVGWD